MMPDIDRVVRFAAFMALAAVMACTPDLRRRSAAPCPPPPPAPECRPTPHTGSGLLPAPWTMVPVRGLDVRGIEEFFTTDTLRGSTYATLDNSSHNVYGTRVLPGSVIGDADVVAMNGNTPMRLPFNAPVYWDGHPTSISPTLLVFASDRPGTMGGTDLWYVTVDKGQWSAPVRLTSIASACDELSPWFVAAENMLYFSSAGHGTVGGYDIVRSQVHTLRTSDGRDSLVADAPQNVGTPINSSYDDMFPVVLTDSIYVSSDRRDGSDMDVFVSFSPTGTRVPRSTPRTPAAPDTTKPTTTIAGTVINAETQQPVVDAEVTARKQQTNDVIAMTRTDTTGSYELKVPVETPIEVAAQSKDLFYDSFDTTLPRTDAGRVVQRSEQLALPTTFYLRVNFPTSIFDAPYENTLDSNGVESSQSWTNAINSVADNVKLTGSTLKRLVLIGHTDDVGTDASNLTLGRQRVEFIMAELEKRGVPRALLEGRSAGERLKPDRREDEPLDVWRKRSRRVELVKVLQK